MKQVVISIFAKKHEVYVISQFNHVISAVDSTECDKLLRNVD